MALDSRFGASAGLLAALAMLSTPASAAELPTGLVKAAEGSAVFADFDTTTYDAETQVADWRGRGWRHGGWRRHRRVDAGDVVAGVLILGGIAAIADAANNRRRNRDVVIVDRDQRYDRRDDRRRYDRREDGTRGLDRAVDQCVGEIQRDVRVDTVDGVDRTAQGWVVTGTLFNGSGFTCSIDNNGRIDAIDYDGFQGAGFEAGPASADGQLDDDVYRTARANVRPDQRLPDRTYDVSGTVDEDLRPAYPGGPLPGEELPE
jgi:hypothetical protein